MLRKGSLETLTTSFNKCTKEGVAGRRAGVLRVRQRGGVYEVDDLVNGARS